MAVSIRDNPVYRAKIKSIVQKNIQSDDRTNGHIKDTFAILARWRKSMPKEDRAALHAIFAKEVDRREARRKIEAKWMRILLSMPKPRYLH